MKDEQDYLRDIAEIRSMMERSSKFLSLAGWAGIMAGIYALSGAYLAVYMLDFNPGETITTKGPTTLPSTLSQIIFLALVIFSLATGTAVFLSNKKASKRGEKLWNTTTKRLVTDMIVPLIIGGLLILILITKGMIGLIAPFSLLFYGLALYNASKFTYPEVKLLGLIEIGLGLLGSYYTGLGMLFWALGFGISHIVYGIYMHYKYEK